MLAQMERRSFPFSKWRLRSAAVVLRCFRWSQATTISQRVRVVLADSLSPPAATGASTAAGDLFALGKVLEEMLVHRTEMPQPPDAAREKLDSIAKKACAKNPAERFASAKEMRVAVMVAHSQPRAS